jgi:hypothetical protein
MPVRRQRQHAGRRERVRVRGRSPRAVSTELRAAAEDDDELAAPLTAAQMPKTVKTAATPLVPGLPRHAMAATEVPGLCAPIPADPGEFTHSAQLQDGYLARCERNVCSVASSMSLSAVLAGADERTVRRQQKERRSR